MEVGIRLVAAILVIIVVFIILLALAIDMFSGSSSLIDGFINFFKSLLGGS
jgi:hypothetical protein